MASSGYPFPEEPAGDLEARKRAKDGEIVKATWKGRLWDTFDLPPLERKLLFKVDAVMLTFASLGYFLKNLDQQNINSAFLSGMKEDLGMHGNELVTAVTIWTVGYVIGQIPSNMLLTRFEARLVIPALELGWGIATLGSYAVKNYQALYALRFLVGLFESGFYPGIHYLLGSWYTPRELGKRAMIFWLAGSLGNMFSGFLQAAAYRNLNGVHGLAGWRWLFIIDAIITLPIALAGFVFFPSAPLQDKKAWWLSEDQHELSKTRLQNIGRAGRTPWTKARIKTLLRSWHTYVLPMLYVIWNNGGGQSAMGYWLKSFNDPVNPPVPGKTYSVEDINQLPLPTKGIFIISAIAYAWLSDGPFHGRRWPFIYLNGAIAVVIGIIFVKLDLYANIKKTMILYWFQDFGSGAGPLILTWINEICSDDTEKRALLVAAGNDFAYVLQSIVPNFVWKTTDFPEARIGWTYSTAMNALLIVWTTLILLLLKRDEKKAFKSASVASIDAGIEDPDEKGIYTPQTSEQSALSPLQKV
ncbi:pantothenate transporter [Kwoniella heveanensis BCC8398]|uniref:Pantothenate transporter n=1 Tax=Kwoniella heveanensis BCC8398 TaxID=1296120 RepID=A0A1B9GMS2_9TREE|nr:pantothenate transporter [Kwoniella heveanensis BCC8398]